jgi:hypothetical protein
VQPVAPLSTRCRAALLVSDASIYTYARFGRCAHATSKQQEYTPRCIWVMVEAAVGRDRSLGTPTYANELYTYPVINYIVNSIQCS